MDRTGVMRMCIVNRNIPAMLANITTLLAKDHVNVENMTNKSRGDYAYTMVDLGAKVDQNVIEDVMNLPGVIRVRVIE
jgi:D-3-phosphoglycerate dehydrogenase